MFIYIYKGRFRGTSKYQIERLRVREIGENKEKEERGREVRNSILALGKWG